MIGRCTYSEFRNILEKDKALTRRFQTVEIKEPDREKSLEILKKLKSKYEKFHKVKYSDKACEKAIDLSVICYA